MKDGETGALEADDSIDKFLVIVIYFLNCSNDPIEYLNLHFVASTISRFSAEMFKNNI